MNFNVIVQKLKYNVPKEPLKLAEFYFGIMSIVNNLELAKREIQLMAFTAVKGNIGSALAKREFVKVYDSSLATVGNIVSKLVKSGLLVKDKRKQVVVNKMLQLEFEKNLRMEITFEHAVE